MKGLLWQPGRLGPVELRNRTIRSATNEHLSQPDGQLTLLELGCPENAATQPRRKAPAKSVSELVAIPYLYLDLSPGHVDLFGNPYWELRSPYREGKPPLNTGPAPREPCPR